MWQVRKEELREKGPTRILLPPPFAQHQPGGQYQLTQDCWLMAKPGIEPWPLDDQVRACFNTQRHPGYLCQQYQGSGNKNGFKTQSLSLRYLHSILLVGGFHVCVGGGGSGGSTVDF